MGIWVPIVISLCMSIPSSTQPPIHLSFHLPICPPTYPNISLSIHPPVHLFTLTSISMSVPSVHIHWSYTMWLTSFLLQSTQASGKKLSTSFPNHFLLFQSHSGRTLFEYSNSSYSYPWGLRSSVPYFCCQTALWDLTSLDKQPGVMLDNIFIYYIYLLCIY